MKTPPKVSCKTDQVSLGEFSLLRTGRFAERWLQLQLTKVVDEMRKLRLAYPALLKKCLADSKAALAELKE